MSDPLQNPRPVWLLHYDHRTLMGKWGRFIARAFRLQTSGERYLNQLRKEADRCYG